MSGAGGRSVGRHTGGSGGCAGKGGRRGSGLVESLLAVLLTTGLLILLGTVLMHLQRTSRSLLGRLEGVESARVARDLIDLALAADPEGHVQGGELRIRSFVGVAERCGEEGWRYRGRRLPDPRRDSLWVVAGSGRVRVVDLAGSPAGRCPVTAPGRPLGLEADPPLAANVRLVRVFESGRYRIDDAVRYGRPGTGAEPLTGAVLDRRRSGVADGPGGISVRVAPSGREVVFERGWRR